MRREVMKLAIALMLLGVALMLGNLKVSKGAPCSALTKENTDASSD